jgi:hypothetical protein
MSSEAFKEMALAFLNKKDAALLKKLSLGLSTESVPAEADGDSSPISAAIRKIRQCKKGTGCKFIDRWKEWELTLRLNLARYRSLNLYHDNTDTIEPPVSPSDAYTVAANVATHESSPIENEIILDKARWNAVDLFTHNDYFNKNNVYAYYLKLLLLERRQLFDAETGFAEYKSLYAQIIESPHGYVENSGHTGEYK